MTTIELSDKFTGKDEVIIGEVDNEEVEKDSQIDILRLISGTRDLIIPGVR